MRVEVIGLDADDTLWHNMRHFAEAEDSLVDMLQPFTDANIARIVRPTVRSRCSAASTT